MYILDLCHRRKRNRPTFEICVRIDGVRKRDKLIFYKSIRWISRARITAHRNSSGFHFGMVIRFALFAVGDCGVHFSGALSHGKSDFATSAVLAPHFWELIARLAPPQREFYSFIFEKNFRRLNPNDVYISLQFRWSCKHLFVRWRKIVRAFSKKRSIDGKI